MHLCHLIVSIMRAMTDSFAHCCIQGPGQVVRHFSYMNELTIWTVSKLVNQA